MSKEDRDNILDQHKELYNGYTMQNQTNTNQQPLYVQDFANDKGGINIDIHGNVKPYTNFGINESRGLDMIGDGDVDLKNGTVDFEDVMSHNDDYDFGFDYPEHESYENNMMVDGDDDNSIFISLGEMKRDMIGDGDDDLEHGTYGKSDEKFNSKSFNDTLFDDEEFDDIFDDEDSDEFEDEDEWSEKVNFKTKFNDDIEEFYESDELGSEFPLDDESLQSLTESVNKSLDMFRRFKKY
jgi:hypothetical protein